MEEVRNKLDFQGLLVVEAQGRSGCLALLWKESDQVKLLSFSNYHIDVEVNIQGMNPWRLTGDMNNIVAQIDKRCGVLYPQWLLDGFNEVLTETGLKDLDLYGHQYTWERGRNTTTLLEIRLDRAMANSSWFDLFPLTKLYNLEGSPSNHSPIFMEPVSRQKGNYRKKFHFENAWLMEPLCMQIIRDNWLDNTSNIVQKVEQCGEMLSKWGKEITGSFGKRIRECKMKLKDLRVKGMLIPFTSLRRRNSNCS
ncbi:uncharacterized protein LOC141695859 [Apium graveolens]|uniref:uncharacterized protein LOC141695859 n=1 Tax=Apium graveolens TaxID=4045 RepID=UPI003D7AD248